MISKESAAIYLAGLIQGIALVAFPAASTIFTNPHEFNFSSTAYGSLFIPEALLSLAASALNPALSRHLGSKWVYILGLIANLLSMILLSVSAFVMENHTLAYFVLLSATSCLGLGFGLTVPTLNAMAALLNPANIDRVLLVLNALLGIGTALAPVFISLFEAFGFWWELPALLTILLILIIVFSLPLELPGGKINIEKTSSVNIPTAFWLFALFALLYGIIETLNGNWVSIYMEKHFYASLEVQSFALTAFWGMVTFGRVFFATIEKFFRGASALQLTPFISAAAFVLTALLPPGAKYWGIAAFGLNGFGCSALLPLIISMGNKQLESIAASIPGMLIAFYLVGYGIAAFGVGPLDDFAHLKLKMVYIMGAVIAILLGVIAHMITRTTHHQGEIL